LPPCFHISCHRYIEHHLSPGMRDRCYFFNSFFYKKLTEQTPANARRKPAPAAAKATPAPARAPPAGAAAQPQEPLHIELGSPSAAMAPHEVQAALRAESSAGDGAQALEQALTHAASGEQELGEGEGGDVQEGKGQEPGSAKHNGGQLAVTPGGSSRAGGAAGMGSTGAQGRGQPPPPPQPVGPKELKARNDHARVKNWTKVGGH
jgi:hypothetical protein